jgi:type IV pilus assembly protein PilC
MMSNVQKAPTLTLAKQKIVFYNGKKAKPNLMARSLRALAMCLRVGEAEARSLEITGEQFAKYDIGRAFTRAAERMRNEGATFKQAMLVEDVFPRTVRELIAAAPTSSGIHKNLVQAAKLVAQGETVKKKLIVAMIQPGFMLAMCLVFLFVASAVILPGFITTFASLNAETPPATLIVMQAAEITKWAMGFLILAILLFTGYWAIWGRRSLKVRVLMDTISIRIPVMGAIIQLAATSRLFELLSTNLLTGMGESQALESAGSGAGNEAIRHHTSKHAEKMRTEGARMADFTITPLLPENAKYMMASAPSVKQQIDIMLELGPEYRDEADVQLEAFTKTIEPLVNYIVYGVVGLLIVAVMVPMYSMFPALMEMGETKPSTSTVEIPTDGSAPSGGADTGAPAASPSPSPSDISTLTSSPRINPGDS